MQEDNNPFQVNPTPAGVDAAVPIVPDAIPAEPVAPAKKKSLVAVDGVSVNYDDPNLYASSSQPDVSPVVEAPETYPATDPNMAYPAMPAMPEVSEGVAVPAPAMTPIEGDYTNPLIEDQPPVDNPIESIPELSDPNETAVEINNGKPGLTFKAWQFFLAAGVAVVGIAGTIFFFIENNQTSANFQETLNLVETYRSQSETGQKAAEQLESLQETVREQAEKITQLKEENDKLKKTEDELKKAKEENDKLRQERDDAQKALVNATNR